MKWVFIICLTKTTGPVLTKIVTKFIVHYKYYVSERMSHYIIGIGQK